MSCVRLAVIDVKLVRIPRNVSHVMPQSTELPLHHYALAWQNIMIQQRTVKLVYHVIIHVQPVTMV